MLFRSKPNRNGKTVANQLIRKTRIAPQLLDDIDLASPVIGNTPPVLAYRRAEPLNRRALRCAPSTKGDAHENAGTEEFGTIISDGRTGAEKCADPRSDPRSIAGLEDRHALDSDDLSDCI